MKKYLLCLILGIFLSGCSTVKLPSYIQDNNPYKMTFYEDYDSVHRAVLDVLTEEGWVIEKTADPLDFEFQNNEDEISDQQILIMTKPRKNKLSLGVSNRKVNVYIRGGKEKVTNLEVRYLVATTLKLKTIYDYKADKRASRFFSHIGRRLEK